jgi:hypothetical protein
MAGEAAVEKLPHHFGNAGVDPLAQGFAELNILARDAKRHHALMSSLIV